jgi:hypothetical protein
VDASCRGGTFKYILSAERATDNTKEGKLSVLGRKRKRKGRRRIWRGCTSH